MIKVHSVKKVNTVNFFFASTTVLVWESLLTGVLWSNDTAPACKSHWNFWLLFATWRADFFHIKNSIVRLACITCSLPLVLLYRECMHYPINWSQLFSTKWRWWLFASTSYLVIPAAFLFFFFWLRHPIPGHPRLFSVVSGSSFHLNCSWTVYLLHLETVISSRVLTCFWICVLAGIISPKLFLSSRPVIFTQLKLLWSCYFWFFHRSSCFPQSIQFAYLYSLVPATSTFFHLMASIAHFPSGHPISN